MMYLAIIAIIAARVVTGGANGDAMFVVVALLGGVAHAEQQISAPPPPSAYMMDPKYFHPGMATCAWYLPFSPWSLNESAASRARVRLKISVRVPSGLRTRYIFGHLESGTTV